MTYTEHQHLFSDSLPPLSRKEEKAYIAIAKTNPNPRVRSRAREVLVRSTFRFLGRIAQRYAAAWGMDAEELAAEAKLHLWTAFDKFKPEKGVRFLSFAAWDIRHAFQVAHGRESVVRNMTEDDHSVSLDSPLYGGEAEGDAMTYKDMLQDHENPHPSIGNLELEHALYRANEVMDKLSASDNELLSQYFGLGGRTVGLTLKELAESRGVWVNSVHTRVKAAMRNAKRAAGKLA